MQALELKSVEKSFKKRRGEIVRALDSISLSVGKGEVVGILGPNGSGKSTLVRVISTLVLPDSGEVEIFGVNAVKHPKQVQRSMNRVSVEASFFKKLSAMENLLYGAKLYGVTSREARTCSVSSTAFVRSTTPRSCCVPTIWTRPKLCATGSVS
ncbi:MAG: ATP-binding cassette domain-containing protein [Actinomycetota bacterium]|nr:ATP-binding cassette domain-containing protein [Actinomycetota bacterium]